MHWVVEGEDLNSRHSPVCILTFWKSRSLLSFPSHWGDSRRKQSKRHLKDWAISREQAASGNLLPWEPWELTAYLQPNQPPAALFMSPLRAWENWEEPVVKIGSALKRGAFILNNYYHTGLRTWALIHSCQDRFSVNLRGILGMIVGHGNAWLSVVKGQEQFVLLKIVLWQYFGRSLKTPQPWSWSHPERRGQLQCLVHSLDKAKAERGLDQCTTTT